MAKSRAEERLVEQDDLLMQPGTYFNPQTEVLVVVDDSASLDQEIFNMEAYEGADWVRISDEVPVDEDRRDVVLEEFQTQFHPGSAAAIPETALEQSDDDTVEEEPEGPQPAEGEPEGAGAEAEAGTEE